MSLRPLHDYVIVHREEPETVTPGGLHIPEDARPKQLEGIVEAVGPGRKHDDGTRTPCEVQVGDRVLFGKYSGDAVEWTQLGEGRLIMHESEIFAILEHPRAM